MSRYKNPLMHFVGSKLKSERKQYEALNEILKTKKFIAKLEEEIFGRDYFSGKGFGRSALPICFTDLPEDRIEGHVKKYSSFGIAFERTYIIENGGNPVFYWAKECGKLVHTSQDLVKYMDDLEKAIKHSCTSELPLQALSDFQKLIWPILNLSKYFEANVTPNVYEEQEWRILTDEGEWTFDITRVSFLTAPTKYVDELREQWPSIEIKEINL